MALTVLDPPIYRGTRWTASPGAVAEEVARLQQIAFFRYEEHSLRHETLVVLGVISHARPYSGVESLRVRLEYPDDFPHSEPTVFDHDKVFAPSAAGHQFSNHALCLQFAPRREFSTNALTLGSEVLGSAMNWMVKRNIFERSGGKNWPGDVEHHGYARPYRQLAMERAAAFPRTFLPVWVEWAVNAGAYPRVDGMCPCLSGRTLGNCHNELAHLVERAVYYSILEASRRGH